MKLLAVEYGIHTIELYASAVPYEQSQQIIEALLARNAFYKMRETEQLYEDRYGVDRTYRSDIFSSGGITKDLPADQTYDESFLANAWETLNK